MSAIFEPEWTAEIGPKTYRGKGLLTKELHSSKSQIDKFVLPVGRVTLSVFPKISRVHLNDSLYFQAHEATPRSLMWLRTMQFTLGTGDGSVSESECMWYVIGLTIEGFPDWSLRVSSNYRILDKL